MSETKKSIEDFEKNVADSKAKLKRNLSIFLAISGIIVMTFFFIAFCCGNLHG